MTSPHHLRSSFRAVKRIKISPPVWNQPLRAGLSSTCRLSDREITTIPSFSPDEVVAPIRAEPLRDVLASVDGEGDDIRLPRSVQAVYLKPLRRNAGYGVPSCDLQLRSYNVRNVDFFSDFALRAAYYLKLPARGPIPLPRITERWTVPRSNFVHKKSQENFERITLRRLIQIQDGDPEVVEIWLAFLRKHAYYGVGMKANIYEHEKLGVGKTMDVSLENLKQALEPKWAHFGRKKNLDISEKVVEMLSSERFRHTADAPLSKV
ncbi:Tryptophan--tRNA ligase, mitochondrial [Acarospora aff. strigata]|nr:Tryptophan--tRNA ligase, mitochondrial [Acarospora aff. strigata]